MCFFSKPKTPEVIQVASSSSSGTTSVAETIPESTPVPVSPSVVQPTSVQAQTASQRRKAIQNMRYGLMSTIKTSTRGTTGLPSLYTPQASGLKKKMGE